MTAALIAKLESASEYDTNGGCWLWTGSLSFGGYGKININRKTKSVHRLSYEAHKGPIAPGAFVCHKCDVRVCFNPDHLFEGSCADNNHDMARKGRAWQPSGGAAHKAKLTDDQAREIVSRFHGGEPRRSLAERFSVSLQTVCNVLVGHTFADATAILRASAAVGAGQ